MCIKEQSRKAQSHKPAWTDPIYLRDTRSVRSSLQRQPSSSSREGNQARCFAWILFTFLLPAAARQPEAPRWRTWDEHRSKGKFVIKCILKGRDMARNEGPQDNGMCNSSSVGQFLLHFRSAVVQVIIMWSVLLNQFGSLNTASNV